MPIGTTDKATARPLSRSCCVAWPERGSLLKLVHDSAHPGSSRKACTSCTAPQCSSSCARWPPVATRERTSRMDISILAVGVYVWIARRPSPFFRSPPLLRGRQTLCGIRDPRPCFPPPLSPRPQLLRLRLPEARSHARAHQDRHPASVTSSGTRGARGRKDRRSRNQILP